MCVCVQGGAVAAEQDSGTLLTEKLKENEAIVSTRSKHINGLKGHFYYNAQFWV